MIWNSTLQNPKTYWSRFVFTSMSELSHSHVFTLQKESKNTPRRHAKEENSLFPPAVANHLSQNAYSSKEQHRINSSRNSAHLSRCQCALVTPLGSFSMYEALCKPSTRHSIHFPAKRYLFKWDKTNLVGYTWKEISNQFLPLALQCLKNLNREVPVNLQ